MFDIKTFIETFIIQPICSRLLPELREVVNKKDAQLLTYEECRQKLRISKPVFYRILRRNELPFVELDKKTFRIDIRDLESYINNSKTNYGKDQKN